jgi:hypothetical protein
LRNDATHAEASLAFEIGIRKKAGACHLLGQSCNFSSDCFVLQMDRYEEYPKMRELIQRKDDLVAQKATPPYYLNVNNFFTLCKPNDGKALTCHFGFSSTIPSLPQKHTFWHQGIVTCCSFDFMATCLKLQGDIIASLVSPKVCHELQTRAEATCEI